MTAGCCLGAFYAVTGIDGLLCLPLVVSAEEFHLLCRGTTGERQRQRRHAVDVVGVIEEVEKDDFEDFEPLTAKGRH